MDKNKYGILTFHRALNYGAILQAYAMQITLEKYDLDAEIIDYRAEFNEKRFAPKKIKDILTIRSLYNIIFRNSYTIHKREPFRLFIENFMKVSKKKSVTREELIEASGEYNSIICGSDQVWNLACTDMDDSFLLPFELRKTKKISYAASFGSDMLAEKHKEKYRKCLNDFSRISVREKSGVSIVKDLIDEDIPYVLDPSLLLSRKEWCFIGDDSIVPKENYVLVYLMSEDKVLLNTARKIAKNKGLKIVYINNRLFKARGMQSVSAITPNQWIALFDKAAYVVTNSFHGTAFAINFNLNFYVKYIPRSIANTRLENILKDTGLTNRLVDVKGQYTDEVIDFTKPNRLLNNERVKSLTYLKDSINSSKDD
jgi:hypothetical protein